MTLVSQRLLALVLAGVLLAACGSRVDDDDRAATAAAGASNAGLTAPAGARPTSAPSPGVTVAGSIASAGGSGIAPVGDAPATPGATGAGSTAASGPSTGRGFDEDEIRIGYLTWNEVSTAGSAVGFAVDYGNQEAIANAIVDDLNARGGIGGRKVVPVFYDYRTSEILSSPEAADQAACTRMTEDTTVYAVVAVTGVLGEVLPQCLYDHQTPLIVNTNVPLVREAFDRWTPYLWSTASPMTERFVPVWFQRAAAAGYFEPWDATVGGPGTAPTTIGLLISNSESGRLFADLVKAELARLGYEVAVTFEVSDAFDTDGFQAAVLQFRSKGVTHVIPESLLMLLFPQSAESQRYRPRYAVSTAAAPLLVQSATPPEQLNGALGVGYAPSYDVANGQDPGDPSPAAGRCREIQSAAGNDPQQRESWNLMGKACDGFAYLAAAVDAAGLRDDAMAVGTPMITSLDAAGVFHIVFGPGRPDGVGAVRDLGYDMSCECFVYLNSTNHPLL
jgi:ABC-type branched-subunit amino acid transport system substrate-binding protein